MSKEYNKYESGDSRSATLEAPPTATPLVQTSTVPNPPGYYPFPQSTNGLFHSGGGPHPGPYPERPVGGIHTNDNDTDDWENVLADETYSKNVQEIAKGLQDSASRLKEKVDKLKEFASTPGIDNILVDARDRAYREQLIASAADRDSKPIEEEGVLLPQEENEKALDIAYDNLLAQAEESAALAEERRLGGLGGPGGVGGVGGVGKPGKPGSIGGPGRPGGIGGPGGPGKPGGVGGPGGPGKPNLPEPDQGLPEVPNKPDQGLPTPPAKPGNALPEQPARPDQGLPAKPGSPARPDQGLPPSPEPKKK